MLITYGRFGVYADIALVVNAFLILGIMAMFNATLTLPGIAGFILTIGAAVDANVLINERIREEIRRGRRLLDAVETGYREAFRAIFDANVTHVISATIMGAKVGVMIRSAAELAAVTKANPFADQPGNRVVAFFLDDAPPKDFAAAATNVADERLALGTREIYVHYPSGQGQSKLRIPAAKDGTARNMNTVARLAELAKEME